MARGAKPGENRFQGVQKALTSYRQNRLNEVVVPKISALAAHTSISSINKFCKLASDIYNEDLPVNEKKISYRRLNQSKEYWEIIGPTYYKHFAKKPRLEEFKSSSSATLSAQRIKELENQLERLITENKALRLTLAGTPAEKTNNDKCYSEILERDLENMGKTIELLISKYGVVKVDIENFALRDLSDDLEPSEGMLPRSISETYIRWLKNKETKITISE